MSQTDGQTDNITVEIVCFALHASHTKNTQYSLLSYVFTQCRKIR